MYLQIIANNQMKFENGVEIQRVESHHFDHYYFLRQPINIRSDVYTCGCVIVIIKSLKYFVTGKLLNKYQN